MSESLQRNVATLAAEGRALLERVEGAIVSAAIEAGGWLAQAKADLDNRTDFLDLLKELGISESTAGSYIRIHAHRDEPQITEAKTIRGAVAALAGPSRKRKPKASEDDAEVVTAEPVPEAPGIPESSVVSTPPGYWDNVPLPDGGEPPVDGTVEEEAQGLAEDAEKLQTELRELHERLAARDAAIAERDARIEELAAPKADDAEIFPTAEGQQIEELRDELREAEQRILDLEDGKAEPKLPGDLLVATDRQHAQVLYAETGRAVFQVVEGSIIVAGDQAGQLAAAKS